MLEIQKLAYFLQAAGEPLKLDYAKHQYGPYAETLHHVLQNLEGHYIRGYGDRSNGSMVYLMVGAAEAAREALLRDPEAVARIERVAQLIEGFETPYGMELLATVHWVAHADEMAAREPGQAIEAVRSWSARKQSLFKTEHIRKAWNRLQTEGWLAQQASPAHQLSLI